MRKITWLCGVAVICLLAVPCALGTAQAQTVAEADAGFLQTAAASGIFEQEAAKLAEQRADSSKVKDYAAKMLEQHRDLAAELQALASEKKVSLPGQPSESDRETLAQLEARKGPEFDRVYVEKAAVDAHVKMNRLFDTAAHRASDPQVREFAQRKLPVVAEHLAMSRALQSPQPADSGRILPPVKGEAPAVSPASRNAPASVTPQTLPESGPERH